MPSAELLKKIAGAKASGQGKYFDAGGRYLLKIDKLALEDKRKGNVAFIAEHTIVEAHDTGEQNLKLENGALVKYKVPCHVVGDSRNYVKIIPPGDEDKEKMALGDIMAYLEALQPDLKTASEAEKMQFLELATGPKQIFKGKLIEVDVSQKAQKTNATKTFTQHNWKNVPAEKQPK